MSSGVGSFNFNYSIFFSLAPTVTCFSIETSSASDGEAVKHKNTFRVEKQRKFKKKNRLWKKRKTHFSLLLRKLCGSVCVCVQKSTFHSISLLVTQTRCEPHSWAKTNSLAKQIICAWIEEHIKAIATRFADLVPLPKQYVTPFVRIQVQVSKQQEHTQ